MRRPNRLRGASESGSGDENGPTEPLQRKEVWTPMNVANQAYFLPEFALAVNHLRFFAFET